MGWLIKNTYQVPWGINKLLSFNLLDYFVSPKNSHKRAPCVLLEQTVFKSCWSTSIVRLHDKNPKIWEASDKNSNICAWNWAEKPQLECFFKKRWKKKKESLQHARVSEFPMLWMFTVHDLGFVWSLFFFTEAEVDSLSVYFMRNIQKDIYFKMYVNIFSVSLP